MSFKESLSQFSQRFTQPQSGGLTGKPKADSSQAAPSRFAGMGPVASSTGGMLPTGIKFDLTAPAHPERKSWTA
jgi:hypothetical protein